MDYDELTSGFAGVVDSGDWFTFVGLANQLVGDLEREESDTPVEAGRDAIREDGTISTLARFVLGDSRIADRYLAADVLGTCATRAAVEFGLHVIPDVPSQRMRRRLPRQLVIEHYVDGLQSTISQLLVKNVISQPQSVRLGHMLSNKSYERRGRGGNIPLVAPDETLSIPDFDPHESPADTGSTGVLPGDVVFRSLNFRIFQFSFKNFGHAGIYIGPRQPGDPFDKHLIVEMVKKGCRTTTVAAFQAEGQFWGYYSAGLDGSQRRFVVSKARSYVGRARYAFTKNYKNPDSHSPQFRCDGLVEHCYEECFSGSTPPTMFAHRGGLFEEDQWQLMSPASLRNCLPIKL